MTSAILAVARQGITDQKQNRVINHLFGGVVEEYCGHFDIEHGIDYGGKFGVNDEGDIARVKASHVMLVPISQDASKRFKKFVGTAVDLEARERLPFYFSADLTKKPEQGRHKQPANCITLFNLAAQSAGIDLSLVHKNWYELKRGHAYGEALTDIFKKAKPCARVAEDYEVDQITLDGAADMPAIQGSENHATISKILGMMDRHFDGALTKYMQKKTPLAAPPTPLPKLWCDL